MKTARELAHELHPVQMARCACDGGVTRTPGSWCAKVTAAIEARDLEWTARLYEEQGLTTTAETALGVAREALEQWKCPLCSGSGEVPAWRYEWVDKGMTKCRTCDGDGLFVLARRALAALSQERRSP